HNHGVTPAARAMPRRVGRPRLMATIHVRTWISFRDTGCHVAPSISKGESGIGYPVGAEFGESSSSGGIRQHHWAMRPAAMSAAAATNAPIAETVADWAAGAGRASNTVMICAVT